MKNTKTYKEEFEELGYSCLSPINEEETKKNIKHLYKDGNYVASIRMSGKNVFSFNRKTYKDKTKLIEDILEYNKGLEFSAKTYDPDMVDKYRTEIRIYETIKNFGFEPAGRFASSDNMVSEGILGMLYGQVLNGECLSVGPNSWIDLYDKNSKTDEEKCASIRSYLFAIYASNISKLCELLANVGKLSKLNDIKVKKLNEKTMNIEEVSVLEDIKNALSKGLEILK